MIIVAGGEPQTGRELLQEKVVGLADSRRSGSYELAIEPRVQLQFWRPQKGEFPEQAVI